MSLLNIWKYCGRDFGMTVGETSFRAEAAPWPTPFDADRAGNTRPGQHGAGQHRLPKKKPGGAVDINAVTGSNGTSPYIYMCVQACVYMRLYMCFFLSDFNSFTRILCVCMCM